MDQIIKFRCWNKITKQFYIFTEPVACFTILNSGQHFGIFFKTVNGPVVPLADWDELEQFTGKKDKNGYEMFVGDIVRVWEMTSPFNKSVNDMEITDGVIVWDNKDASFGIKFGKYIHALNNAPCIYKRIIIGNIHENPELLKGERQ